MIPRSMGGFLRKSDSEIRGARILSFKIGCGAFPTLAAPPCREATRGGVLVVIVVIVIIIVVILIVMPYNSTT